MADDHEGEALFRKSTGNLKQNVSFLRYPSFLPVRHPGRRYVYGDGQAVFEARCDGTIEVKSMGSFIDGEMDIWGLPSGADAKVLYALMSRIRREGHRWVARFDSGEELYRTLGRSGGFDGRDADRVSETIIRCMMTVLAFHGCLYDRDEQQRVKGKVMFHAIDHARVIKVGRCWKIKVVFNDEFINETLIGYSALLHLPTFYGLRSDFARRLFEWLTAALDYQNENKIGLGKLLGQLGFGSGDTLQNPAKQVNRVRDAVEEINDTLPAYSRRYACVVRKDHVITFFKYARRKRHRLVV